LLGGARRAGVAEGAHVSAAPGADGGVFARAGDRPPVVVPAATAAPPAFAGMDDPVAVGAGRAGVGEGLAVAAALAADRGVLEGTRRRPAGTRRRRAVARPVVDDDRAAGEHDGGGGEAGRDPGERTNAHELILSLFPRPSP